MRKTNNQPPLRAKRSNLSFKADRLLRRSAPRNDIPEHISRQLQVYPAFYQKVWKACGEIPRGETRTYGWIARKIGNPNAARVVGRALGANPFAPTIPCHRVVGADGSLTGYSGPGGLARKKRLLEQEKS
jgi:O-6-methylguanine DNA methyltransferase